MSTLSLDLIEEASSFLESRIRRTPVVKCGDLSEHLGVPVYLKLEFLQITGSFKLRGALFRLSRLGDSERPAGVITSSAGNHGWAVAYAAAMLAIPAAVYLPFGVDGSKVSGIMSLGAEVIRTRFSGYDATENFAVSQAKVLRRTFISPYDDFAVMAANGGTIAKEILEDIPEIRTFIVPVGGGGLASGLGFYAKSRFPDSSLIACQHSESPALKLSLEKGIAVTELPPIRTLAAGIEGGLGTLTFSVLKDLVDETLLVTEEQILDATRWFLAKHRFVIEPSSAVALAACLTHQVVNVQTPAAIVLTGRNFALDSLRAILCPDWREN